ncbi:Beta-arrestin-1 [Schistosoma japonicum]|nr:Beta-arrestin-1 [Schistosoma japonicum]
MLIITSSHNDKPKNGILTITQDVKNAEYVFLILTCSYRFGRDDLDVLGITFQKELIIYTKCLWPNHPFDNKQLTKSSIKWTKSFKKLKRLSKHKTQNINEQITCTEENDDPCGIFSETLKDIDFTPFQSKLLSKYGELAFPFRIILPTTSPSSVAIHPNEDDSRKLYGVSYALTAFAGENLESSQPFNSTVTIILRKYIAGPRLVHRPIYPVAESVRKTTNFMCQSGEVLVTASIDKPVIL